MLRRWPCPACRRTYPPGTRRRARPGGRRSLCFCKNNKRMIIIRLHRQSVCASLPAGASECARHAVHVDILIASAQLFTGHCGRARPGRPVEPEATEAVRLIVAVWQGLGVRETRGAARHA
jgi:hypothetical protein